MTGDLPSNDLRGLSDMLSAHCDELDSLRRELRTLKVRLLSACLANEPTEITLPTCEHHAELIQMYDRGEIDVAFRTGQEGTRLAPVCRGVPVYSTHNVVWQSAAIVD